MVSTRQSSNSGTTNADGSILCCEAAGPSGTSRRSQQSQSAVVVAAAATNNSSYINILDMPVEVLQKILSYLDYNSIARLRPVCHQMDRVCGSILNSAFQRLQTQMLSRFQAIKAQMPRRESARRNHPLACESDIIETLHMRLTLLQMSFGKHIERKHCCFFPGEILDEVNRILHYIKVTPKLARPYKVTDELFDLSTMAMEYFKDCIEPTLPEIPYFGAEFLDLAGTFSSTSSRVNKFSLCLDAAPLSVPEGKSRNSCGGGGGGGGGGSGNGSSSGEASPSCSGNDESGSNSLDNNSSGSLVSVVNSTSATSPQQSNMVLRKRIRKIKQGMKRYNSQLSLMRRELRGCKAKIAEQQKQIVEYATRLDDNDKKSDETSRKFSTLLQELNKCKTELQYWRSKSPAIPVYLGCGGQSVPLQATDDFQSLAAGGGGILPEASFGEALDFIPIADVAARDLDAGVLSMPTAQLPQASTSTVQLEAMAPPPPAAPLPQHPLAKRKSSASNCPALVEDEVVVGKKPRRVLKSRQAKRSKI